MLAVLVTTDHIPWFCKIKIKKSQLIHDVVWAKYVFSESCLSLIHFGFSLTTTMVCTGVLEQTRPPEASSSPGWSRQKEGDTRSLRHKPCWYPEWRKWYDTTCSEAHILKNKRRKTIKTQGKINVQLYCTFTKNDSQNVRLTNFGNLYIKVLMHSWKYCNYSSVAPECWQNTGGEQQFEARSTNPHSIFTVNLSMTISTLVQESIGEYFIRSSKYWKKKLLKVQWMLLKLKTYKIM